MKDELHLRLAELSKTVHGKAAKFVEENLPQNELTATRLGRYRVEIKKIFTQRNERDRWVGEGIGGVKRFLIIS